MHTVEKIGGTSMSQFRDIMNNVIIAGRQGPELYNRIFVVSAYGGITDLLLEHKKTGKYGVYAFFAEGDPQWEEALEAVKKRMYELNAGFAEIGLDAAGADAFVHDRLEGIRRCMLDLQRICSYGHFHIRDHLMSVREMLSAVGEAHSAWNSVNILRKHKVQAHLIDLSGWMDTENLPFDQMILRAFKDVDVAQCLPMVTGYTKCAEGIMTTFDRGYSEITFSKIAVLTRAAEGVIHKEFHLSSSDPKLVGADRVRIIGHTNYDVADQLADIGMEAIHPKAAKGMERMQIPIRVKNAFEPRHPGTLISHDYKSEKPRVEIVAGRKDLLAIEVVDPDMVGQSGYDHQLLEFFKRYQISYVSKNTNANTITHYVPENARDLQRCVEDIKAGLTGAHVRQVPVAIVSAIGSNMKVPGFLSRAAKALADEKINILAMDQCMRQVNMQFIVAREDFEKAVRALHRGVVEIEPC